MTHWRGEERRQEGAQSRTLRPTASCVAQRQEWKKPHYDDERTHPENLTTNGLGGSSPSQPVFSCKRLPIVDREGSSLPNNFSICLQVKRLQHHTPKTKSSQWFVQCFPSGKGATKRALRERQKGEVGVCREKRKQVCQRKKREI